ncbi:MAG TPA: potassium transporter TrkG [Anaerolineae bacterium]|nr:potassium transporter TrkG [Anaerolineae bacterium]
MRHAAFLRERYKAILGYTGLVALITGLLILAPLALLPLYPDEIGEAGAFLLPGLALAGPGLLLWRLLVPRTTGALTTQEGMVVVLLAWILAILAGAVPFMAGSGLAFYQAVFESTSGWTTTGLSVLDVGQATHLILFFRSLTQVAGGAGWAILMLSALGGPLGPGLGVAEGREDQLVPHVRGSAKLVLRIYLAYIVVGILALYAAGMDWFSAVNHAFSSVSTGGFSTRPESIIYWNSAAVETVLVILMLLGATNFYTAYALFKRNWQEAGHNSELVQMALMVVAASAILFAGATAERFATAGSGLRAAVLTTVNALTTTGFSTYDFREWSGLGHLVLILLMVVGGGTGSTAGALKQYRVYVLSRGLLSEFRRRLQPRSVVWEPEMWRGHERQVVSDNLVRQVAVFVFLFVVALVAGTALLVAQGYPLGDSLFEFAAALSTAGVSVGIVRPDSAAAVLWVETAGMFLGRLEFFAVAVGLVRLASDLPALLSSILPRRR